MYKKGNKPKQNALYVPASKGLFYIMIIYFFRPELEAPTAGKRHSIKDEQNSSNSAKARRLLPLRDGDDEDNDDDDDDDGQGFILFSSRQDELPGRTEEADGEI